MSINRYPQSSGSLANPNQPGIRPEAIASFPLLGFFLKWGVIFGLVFAAVFASVLAGVAIFAISLILGLLWSDKEVPIFAFCLFYQWIFAVTGYFFLLVNGRYPAGIPVERIESAVVFSLFGLLALALGIRLGIRKVRYDKLLTAEYDDKRLFTIVVLLFSISWIFEILPNAMFFNTAQIIKNILLLRYLFLLALMYQVINENRNYHLLVMAIFVAVAPELLTGFSRFKEIFYLFGILLLGRWKPWSRLYSDKAVNKKLFTAVAVLGSLILAVGLLWAGGLKMSWRSALWEGEIQGSPIEKLSNFTDYFSDAARNFELGLAVDNLSERVSSGAGYFALTVKRVPVQISHTDGELTLGAIKHVLMPRFLFPDKKNLGGDSWIVRRYAGVYVAGEESETSVGMGYIAEFYIDFGFPLMLAPIFLYGLLVGQLYYWLSKVAGSKLILTGISCVLFIHHLSGYEGNFIKIFGGMLQNFIIFWVFLFFFGRYLNRLISTNRGTAEALIGNSMRQGRKW